MNSLAGKLPQKNLKDLFSNNAVDLIYSTISLENDINTLKQIVSGNFKIKSFSYDGHKFLLKMLKELVNELELDLKKIKEEIIENDKQIYLYFLELAKIKIKILS